MNQVLKMVVNLTPQSLNNVVACLHDQVQCLYTDVERAIFGRGEFRLDNQFKVRIDLNLSKPYTIMGEDPFAMPPPPLP